ncbi:MAG: hypothetical protein QNJ22_21500 [Desulfosarcinaceae bacterium]|nr:hypothetical protein [Desulfosarcinaceae bacterium]
MDNWRLAILLILAAALCSCAGKPFDPPKTGEIPDGPGVFTDNPQGTVVIRVDKDGEDRQNSSREASALEGDTPPSVPTTDYEEFEAYRQWRRWKESAEGSAEYEEFRQWREWREYREWKKKR